MRFLKGAAAAERLGSARDPAPHDPVLPPRRARGDHPLPQGRLPPARGGHREHPLRGRLYRGGQPPHRPGLPDRHAGLRRRRRARLLPDQGDPVQGPRPGRHPAGRGADPGPARHPGRGQVPGGRQEGPGRGRGHYDLPRGHPVTRPPPVAHGRQDRGRPPGHGLGGPRGPRGAVGRPGRPPHLRQGLPPLPAQGGARQDRHPPGPVPVRLRHPGPRGRTPVHRRHDGGHYPPGGGPARREGAPPLRHALRRRPRQGQDRGTQARPAAGAGSGPGNPAGSCASAS